MPLRYAGVQLEFELVNAPTDVLKGNISGQTAVQSESFLIENAQIKCDVVTIDHARDNSYTELLMRGQRLPIPYTGVTCGSQIIRDIKTDIHVPRSLTRLKAIFVTLLKSTSNATGTNGCNGSQEAEAFWHATGDGAALDNSKDLETQIQIGSTCSPTYLCLNRSAIFARPWAYALEVEL